MIPRRHNIFNGHKFEVEFGGQITKVQDSLDDASCQGRYSRHMQLDATVQATCHQLGPSLDFQIFHMNENSVI